MDSFEELYRIHFLPVYRACLARFSRADFAMEITQEAFARALKDFGKLRDPSKFRSWVVTIAYNFGKREGCREKVLYNPLPPSDLLERDWNQVVPEDLQVDDVNFIRRWILTLNEADQRSFLLKYYYSQTDQEISEQISKPLGTVKRRLHDLRLRLARVIRAEFPLQ